MWKPLGATNGLDTASVTDSKVMESVTDRDFYQTRRMRLAGHVGRMEITYKFSRKFGEESRGEDGTVNNLLK